MKKVQGVGINDADYTVQPRINGKAVWCPYYQVWHSMFSRCYSEKCLLKQPTYIDCKICNQWKHFSNFKAWMETQDWEDKQLDKDLLGSGKLYSPETCCFVPQWLNNLFNDHRRVRGSYPLGVSWDESRKKFVAQINVNGNRKRIGQFVCPEEAHSAYLKAKKQYVHSLMKDYPDQRVKEAVLRYEIPHHHRG